jgi:hypothetical protein
MAAQLSARGIASHRPLAVASCEPYGRIDAFALRTPDGVIYEFFSPKA